MPWRFTIGLALKYYQGYYCGFIPEVKTQAGMGNERIMGKNCQKSSLLKWKYIFVHH